MLAARNLLARAIKLLPARDPSRLQLLPRFATALSLAGDYKAEEAVLSEAREAAQELGLSSLEWHARIGQTMARDRTADITAEEMRRVADDAIAIFAELGDDLGQTSAWVLRAKAHWALGQLTAAAAASERALEHAGDAEGEFHRIFTLLTIVTALPWGPTPVDDGIRRCEEVIGDAGGSLSVEIDVLESLASLRAMQGRFHEARSLANRAKALCRDLGFELGVAGTAAFHSAHVEMLAANPASAEHELRFALGVFEGAGERSGLSTAAALLAHALYAGGQYAEAEQLSRASEEAAAADDVWSQIPWRSVRAKVLAQRGELEQAEALARDAVRLAAQTELLNMHGDALLDLGEVLRLAGRAGEAAEVAENAVRLYREKGNVVSADKAGMFVEQVSGMSSRLA